MDQTPIKKLLPHDDEAEKAVVGAMLLNNEVIPEVEQIVASEDFYVRRYGILFSVMTALFNEGKPADTVMVEERLKREEVAPQLAEPSFLADLLMSVPLSTNARYYAGIVAECAQKRRLIKVAEEIANDCYAGRESFDETLDKTEKGIYDILNRRRNDKFVPISRIAVEALEKIYEASMADSPVTGIPTGFVDLDLKLSGLQPSDLVLIAARPSMGKTAFALNIAQHATFRKDMCTAIFSLEMSEEQLVKRLIAMEALVDSTRLRTGQIRRDEWIEVSDAANRIGESKLILDGSPGISIPELRHKCRKYKLDFDLKLVIIDYLQLMSGNSRRSENRQQEISDISRSLKRLARELEIPVIALSQLSRAVESRENHRPMLSDLRESGAIEQDADVVMFIYREDYYRKKDAGEESVELTNEAEIIIAKQRNGPTGSVILGWQPDYTKFVNIERKH